MFKIFDWAGNLCFHGKTFKSFDDAEDFLCVILDERYDDERGDYFITRMRD